MSEVKTAWYNMNLIFTNRYKGCEIVLELRGRKDCGRDINVIHVTHELHSFNESRLYIFFISRNRKTVASLIAFRAASHILGACT